MSSVQRLNGDRRIPSDWAQYGNVEGTVLKGLESTRVSFDSMYKECLERFTLSPWEAHAKNTFPENPSTDSIPTSALRMSALNASSKVENRINSLTDIAHTFRNPQEMYFTSSRPSSSYDWRDASPDGHFSRLDLTNETAFRVITASCHDPYLTTATHLLNWTACPKKTFSPFDDTREIDDALLLAFLLDNIWTDPCKYTSIKAASILTNPTIQQRERFPKMDLFALRCILQKEAESDALLDFSLNQLGEDGFDFVSIFRQDEIAPYFHLQPCLNQPGVNLIFLNTLKIRDTARLTREKHHGPSAVNKKIKEARKNLRRFGLSH